MFCFHGRESGPFSEFYPTRAVSCFVLADMLRGKDTWGGDTWCSWSEASVEGGCCLILHGDHDICWHVVWLEPSMWLSDFVHLWCDKDRITQWCSCEWHAWQCCWSFGAIRRHQLCAGQLGPNGLAERRSLARLVRRKPRLLLWGRGTLELVTKWLVPHECWLFLV